MEVEDQIDNPQIVKREEEREEDKVIRVYMKINFEYFLRLILEL